MSSQFIFPKPRDWATLEDMAADVFSRKFGSYNLQRYGRQGQSQNGIDIVGPCPDGLVGIQCKHHPTGNISVAEIDGEITKSEKFSPILSEFFVVTSADRDTHAHEHVLSSSKHRQQHDKYPVHIKFWQDICDWLAEYPDLVYKHFTKFFPIRDLEDLNFPGLDLGNKKTSQWPVTTTELIDSVSQSLKGASQVTPYSLTMGFSTFGAAADVGITDLALDFSSLFSSSISPTAIFAQLAQQLNDVKSIISNSTFSKEIFVHVEARLTAAFLFGWVFRKVTQYHLTLVSRGQIWTTTGLPIVPTRLIDPLPLMMNPTSREVAVVLDISRNITGSVKDFVQSWDSPPQAVLSIGVEGNRIVNAAHALSVAQEIAWKIKNLFDVSDVLHIHLFGALPASLAVLISYNLNAIRPISLYYLSEDRATYIVGGTLHNNL